ncbi:MAG TPA: M28 family peptidase, partial [Planctomycetota bacterium]|nr:M28 family peptidase [Planctomycetota bacterium]
LRLRAEVETVERRLRTVVAELVGRQRPDEVVGISSHLQEPGAGDNASGVATLLEGATLLAERVASGELDRPDRTIAFVWGDEFRQTEMFLEGSTRKVVAGLSADMTGQSFELTGAIALLERTPDPGAFRVLPPDEHSAWGAGEVAREDIVETGLAVVARCALLDVGLAEDGWLTADHPWEGGSDHDVYLEHGVPAVLFWHFTDFAYHTSLDRPELVDPAEMRRTGAAILATALALADPRPSDLDRYLVSLDAECALRITAAETAEDAELVEMWREWGLGARSWLRVLCLRLEQDEAREVLGRQ